MQTSRCSPRPGSGPCARSRCSRPRTCIPRRASTWRSTTARARETLEEQHCYVCKQPYRGLHPFYDQLCPPCGDVQLREALGDRRPPGQVALLTGGRVKIGYQAGIKLLRAGAQLIVTTRFPRDSAARYAQEADFADWGDRLEIYGLDLRHTPSVEAFCRHLSATHDRLDYIVNNACQTVRRPPDFYRHMLGAEIASAGSLPPEAERLLGGYEGLRRYDMLRDGASGLEEKGLVVSASPSSAAELSQVPLLPEEASRTRASSFPRGASIRISSRSTSATATRGASCSPRSRRSSCSRHSSSTPSRRSSSTRA